MHAMQAVGLLPQQVITGSYPVPTWLKAMLRSRTRVIRLRALVPWWVRT